MNKADRAGYWAIVLLLIVGAGAYFTMFSLGFSFVKRYIGA